MPETLVPGKKGPTFLLARMADDCLDRPPSEKTCLAEGVIDLIIPLHRYLVGVSLYPKRRGANGGVDNKMGGFDRITFDPLILGGRACIRGMRIPVSVIVKQIAHGAAREEVLADYPDLESEDIQQALEYAAWLSQEEVRSA